MDLFDKSHAPVIGKVEAIAPGIRVVTSDNAGPMTFTGTRTYLVGVRSVAVIDPGPDTESQFNIIRQAIENDTVSHIVVTHSHVDHAPLARRLAALTGAKVWAYGTRPEAQMPPGMADLAGGEGIDRDFAPDEAVFDGDVIGGADWQLSIIHTPGHLSDHVSLAFGEYLFSGDHVMGWATTMISPPDGDLNSFMASLDKLLLRPEKTYLPGHGAPVLKPHDLMRHIRDHRMTREAQIVSVLKEGAARLDDITGRIYTDVPKSLHAAAMRNVLAHLLALMARESVQVEDDGDKSRVFFLKARSGV